LRSGGEISFFVSGITTGVAPRAGRDVKRVAQPIRLIANRNMMVELDIFILELP
jgi:hypothetical protein